jgi:catechol 2,3-dioxygenase-like lactoylglutathione lyase family enzyme
MIVERLDAVVIRVRDLQQARQWYESVLGLRVRSADDESHVVTFEAGGSACLSLWQLREGESLTATSRSSSFPMFVVRDAEAARRELAARDVQVAPIEESGSARRFAIFDPDGNRLDLVQRTQ